MTGIQMAWTVVFGIAVFLFLAVEVVVVIGGARDIVDMAHTLLGRASNVEDSGEEAGGA